MLVKAGRKLLRQHPYADVTLASILTASGLHTRAFYRHFQTKDELLVAIYREEAEQLHDILAGKVDAAASPADGVIAWIDEMLRLQFDPRTVAQVSFFREPAASDAMQRLGAMDASNRVLLEPLLRALRAGRDDGSLPGAVPEVHAPFISALVWNGARSVPGRRASDRWEAARELLAEFVMYGLGRSSQPPRRRARSGRSHSAAPSQRR
jgi:AcrR family transcriptional regulator